MTKLLAINKTWQLTAVFVIAAGILFSIFMIGLHFWPDKKDHTVTITSDQFREAIDPYMQHRDSLHAAKEKALQKEIAQAVIAGLKLDSAYTHFQNQQPLRDEKYNRVLTASDAQLYEFFADRYGR